MILLSALRATKVLGLAVVLIAGGMTAAEARDGWRHGHHGHHGHSSKIKRLKSFQSRAHGGGLRAEHRSGGRERDFRRKNRDFYSGAITAYRSHGDDIYFYVDGDRRDRAGKHRRGRSKVTVVTPGVTDCSWEAGVCVMRGPW